MGAEDTNLSVTCLKMTHEAHRHGWGHPRAMGNEKRRGGTWREGQEEAEVRMVRSLTFRAGRLGTPEEES